MKKLDNNLFFLNIQTRVNEGSTIWAGVMELRVQAAAWDQSCATAAAWPTTKAKKAEHEATFDLFQEANLLGLHLGVHSSLARWTDGLDRLFW